MWTDPVAPLLFAPETRRILALALIQGEDERIRPGDEQTMAIVGALTFLDLLDIAPGGHVATDHLRNQAWAQELIDDPFGGWDRDS